MPQVLMAHPGPDLYGSDRMLLQSVRALVDGGVGVTVALPARGPLVPLLTGAGAAVVFLDTAVLRRAALSPRGLAGLAVLELRTLPALVRAVRSTGADLVYVNTLTLPGWLLAARLAGRPVVCHVHEAEQGIPRLVAAGLHAPLLLARQVLVNSGAARDLVTAALPALSGRLRLLYNGVPGPTAEPPPSRPRPDELPPSRSQPGELPPSRPRPGELPPSRPRPDELPPSRPRPAGQVRLVLVGRLSPRKGTDVAVRAVARLVAEGVDASLDLVGDVFPGYEWYAEQLDALVDELGLAGRVRRRGFQDDVWPWLAAADIVVVPSRVEPFGNVAVEGALAGRPVVASAVQGLAEIVRDGATGLLVPPDDPVALAAAVRRLAQDQDLAADLVAQARQQAAARFSPAAYAHALLALLRSAGLPEGAAGRA